MLQHVEARAIPALPGLDLSRSDFMTRFFDRHPVLSALALTLAQASIAALAFLGLPLVAPSLSELDQRFIATVVSAALVLLLIAVLRRWQETGFNGPSSWRDLPLLLLPTALMLLPLANGINPAAEPTLSVFGFFLVAFTLNAVDEEGLFRGLLMHLLDARGLVWSVGVSSVLFGLMHLVRIGFGAPVEITLIQVVLAGATGFFWAVLRLRTNTIWAPVFLHTFANLFSSLGQLPEGLDVVVALGTPVILVAYGVFLLRSRRPSGTAVASPSPALAAR